MYPWDPSGTTAWLYIEWSLFGAAVIIVAAMLVKSLLSDRRRPVPGSYRPSRIWSPRRYWRRPVRSPIVGSAQYAHARITGATRTDAGRNSHRATYL